MPSNVALLTCIEWKSVGRGNSLQNKWGLLKPKGEVDQNNEKRCQLTSVALPEGMPKEAIIHRAKQTHAIKLCHQAVNKKLSRSCIM